MAYTETADNIIAEAYLLATGKVTALSAGTTKYTKLLALLNLFQLQWAKAEAWVSLYSLASAGTVTATDTFAIPLTLNRLSSTEGDFVRIAHTDGINESDYTIVSADRLYDYGPKVNSIGTTLRNANGTVAQIGANLVFAVPFISTNPQFGGTIRVPGYSFPATITTGSTVVSVDDPQWLSTRMAAEYIRNDVTRVQLYGSLVDQAKDLYENMIDQNTPQLDDVNTGSWSPLGSTWE